MDNTNMYNQNPNMQNMNTPAPKVPGYTLWLIISILQIVMVCCCNCVSPIFGIIGLVFTTGGNKAYQMGDQVTGLQKIKVAKIINIIGIISVFIVPLIFGFLGGYGIVETLLSDYGYYF